MRLTKIYTKVGDKGTTLLASGEKVGKDHPRIEAYGTVDELNSFVGLLIDELREANKFTKIIEKILLVQNELFDVGGELSTPLEILDIKKQQVVSATCIKRLEDEIDEMNSQLKPLENFVLPGGHRANSVAHICRTVCRRAERALVRAKKDIQVRDEVVIYLNRLSDWFFVLSRFVSKELSVKEVLWQQAKK